MLAKKTAQRILEYNWVWCSPKPLLWFQVHCSSNLPSGGNDFFFSRKQIHTPYLLLSLSLANYGGEICGFRKRRYEKDEKDNSTVTSENKQGKDLVFLFITCQLLFLCHTAFVL